MDDLDRLLDAYAALPPDERAAVDAQTGADPARQTALAQARRFAAQLDAAVPPPDDDGLAARLAEIQMAAGDPAILFEQITGQPFPRAPQAEGDGPATP